MGLKGSLEKYGQTYEIHHCKFGYMDGWKRFKTLKSLGIEPKVVEHPEIETLEQMRDWAKQHRSVRMMKGEEIAYIIARAQEFESQGLRKQDYAPLIADLVPCTERKVYRILQYATPVKSLESHTDFVVRKTKKQVQRIIPSCQIKCLFCSGTFTYQCDRGKHNIL